MAQALATTLVVASLYALLGAGYVLVYRASRVLNLAQGDLLTLGGYFLFLKVSPLGIRMRAAGERALLASQRGINFHGVFALSWALSAFAGSLAGMIYSSNVRLEPSLGILGLRAFAVALVGGLDSLGGVVPAALLVAAVEVASVRWGNPLLSDVSPFLCLLVML